MTDGEQLTIDDEIVARARIHARTVLDEYDLSVDRDALEWETSLRARRRAGACRWDPNREIATIILARRAYERYDWPTFAGVVRHELVHAWEYQRFGESGHGARFRERAAALDAPRHCQSFSEPRYVLRCRETDCDWEATRHRASKPVKSPDRYRCGSCGGSYEVEHAESGRTWTTASGYGGSKAALGDDW
ncbi:sprT domain-containing protein [Natrarchaeobius halalkaliphilus]|uniref:SprT domain-containing protein n=1 Tax=Natrarchaeobius halalkaliphilus TaxID=1679091 RepID=A0A3N6LSE5_9EURY|nr:SprT-like domain-containing protein [Natrarchaeobius halalkaliphilus]RQG90194.1 sprT domain-containing protein [Natrarchaeobius halalkaliphilus]